MALLTITAASVAPQSNANIIPGTAGVAITAGQLLYYDTVTGTFKLAICSAVAASAVLIGVAVNSSPGAGQPVNVQISGDLVIGSAIVTGNGYYMGATAGRIDDAPVLTTLLYPSFLGMAISTTLLRLAVAPHNNVANT